MRLGILHEAQHDSFIDFLAEVHGFYNNGALISRQSVQDHLLGNLLCANSPHCLAVASTADHTVVGLAALTLVFSPVDFHPNQRKHCQLKELYVRLPFRSAGVGRALMSWVANLLLKIDVTGSIGQSRQQTRAESRSTKNSEPCWSLIA